MTGSAEPAHWSGTTRATDFFDVKGIVELLCRVLDVPIRLVASVEPFLTVRDGLFGDPLRRAAGLNPVRRPLGKHQLHDRLPPPGGGGGGSEVVGVAATTDQGGITESSGSLIQCSARGGGGRDVAVMIEGNGAHCVMRDFGSEQVCRLRRRLTLKLFEPLNFTRDDQVFIVAEWNAVFGGETLGSFGHEVDVRTFTQNFAGGAHGIS